MKFDVVVGNPPYQDGRDKLFYQKFVNRAHEMSNDAVAIITPAGWTSIADLDTQFTKNIIKDIFSYRYLGDKLFNGVQLQVCYFLTSKNNAGTVTLKSLTDETIISRTDLLFFPTGTTSGFSIMSKIKKCANGGLKSTSGKLTRNKAQISDTGYKCIFTAGRKNSDFD